MKTYHNEANTVGITKIVSKKNGLVDRFRKITILRPNCRNKSFLKLNLSKKNLSKVGVLN